VPLGRLGNHVVATIASGGVTLFSKVEPGAWSRKVAGFWDKITQPSKYLERNRIAAEGLAMDALKTAYRAVTRQIEVKALPRFMPERSSPENGYFFWAYTITLTNLGGETVQLKTRHWRITDAQGRLQEVRGPGVVGEQPVLKPGENFEYTSGVPLPTSSGFMTGTYGMVTAAGEEFDIDIPAFSLDAPERERTIN
jgi:ApaG protein